ncbi:hypothetical protein BJX70DRAFT_62642 [Aspergillus crustosus]
MKTATTTDTLAQVFYLLSVSFLAIAAHNTLELLLWISTFFKRRRGLYFWSILTATLSLSAFTTITILSFFKQAPVLATGIGTALCYPCLLTAQLLVLYSRLHLITQGRILQFVRWLIITTSILLFVPFTTCLIGLSIGSKQFLHPFEIIEQTTILAAIVRELGVCAIYIYEAFRQLKPIMAVKGRAASRVFVHLIMVNAAVMVLDAFMIVTTFAGESGMGLTFSCVAHSIKLKMEFGVLNRLVGLLRAPVEGVGPGVGVGAGTGEDGFEGGSNFASGRGS